MINIVLIHQIDRFKKVVKTKEPSIYKKFLTYDPKSKKWIAVDDTTNDFWMEEFERIDAAIIWLNKN